MLHGLPTYGVPLDVAHFIRLSGAAQSGAGVKVWRPRTRPETSRVGQAPVVSVPMAVVQVAAELGMVAGVVAADAALHRRLCNLTDVEMR